MEYPVSYLSVDEIIEFNLLALEIFKVKKKDKHGVLSRQKLSAALEKCRETRGDVYTKAAVLVRALTSAHAFASGNRRTAFIATKEFVIRNGGKFSIPDDPAYARIMQGIREGNYSNDEIREWIAHGKITERRR